MLWILYRLTLLQLIRTQLPQFVHLRTLSRHCTLGNLHSATQYVLVVDRVRRRVCSHLDNADSWVVRSTVVFTVTKVTHPGFQGWRVVFLDNGAVGEDRGFTRDRGPLAGWVQEGNVNFGVILKIVSLARLGVGVEEEIDTTAFLWW